MDVVVKPKPPSPGHSGGTGLNLQTTTKDKEKQDRMIAAEVMAKFSLYATQSEQKYVNDNESSNSDSNDTSSGLSNKVIVTSTTTDSITATTTIDNVNINNNNTSNTNSVKNTILPYLLSTVADNTSDNPSIYLGKKIEIVKPSVVRTLHVSNKDNTLNGIPPTLNQEEDHHHQQQHQKQELHLNSGRTHNTSTDNFLNVSSKSDSFNTRKFSVERVVVNLSPINKTIGISVEESTSPSKTNEGSPHSLSVNINNNSQTSTNKNIIRKKSLPVLNARILKELLDSTNNQGLIYLIHPFNDNDNFLVRSINKKDFINCFPKEKVKQLSDTFISAGEHRILTSTGSENESPVWGIIKNRSVHFFEPTSKESKDLLNNTNILPEHGENNRSSENNSNKDLSNSLIFNSTITEPSPNNEKLTSTLPLKKRKVADSLLSDYGTPNLGLPASTSLVTPDDTSKLLKSVSQFAEKCVRGRSVFIVSPSDVPKSVKTATSNPLDDCSNQQLTKNIEIALHQDEDGDLPLHIAAVQKDLKMVSLYGTLIQRAGKSVDRFNKKHLTPLHFCVKVKFLAGIKKLIQMGADVNALDGNGQSALHIAVSNSDLEGFHFMLQQCLIYVKDIKMKPNLNSHDYEGVTLLHTAVINNNIEMIDRLLQKGAELDAIDFKSGRTPLFYAVENNNIEIVEFLLEKRASVDIPNFAGNTAFYAATCRGYLDASYLEISKLLADNGADTRGLLTPEELTSNPKTTSAVKNQLKNKLVASAANQIPV